MQHINKNLLQSTFNEESITNVLISEPGKETKFTIISSECFKWYSS